MRIYVVERKKIYVAACILACLCIAFVLMHVHSAAKMSVGAFLASSGTDGQKPEQVEIFDIEKGLIFGNYINSAIFRKEACKYLDSITGMYGNVKVFPTFGYIAKIPLDPPVKTSGKLLDATDIVSADTIYIVFPQPGKPYLLILDGQSRPFCFNFDADTSLLKSYFVGSIKTFKPQKPPEYSMEELYYDISMSTLLPYIQRAVDDYYMASAGISPSVDPWQSDILYIERPNGYRTYLFQIKLEVCPYVGPHRSVGKDRITIEVSAGRVSVSKFEHIEYYPIKP